MSRCRSAFIASLVTAATSLLAAFALILASATLAKDALAQTSPADTATYSSSYADVWTPRSRTGEINFHGGLFSPNATNGIGPTLGLRIGLDLGQHVLLGVMGDWTFKVKSLLEPVPGALPGFEPSIELARVDAQLIPAMLFLQVKLTNKFFLVPYLGVAGGYEWLILNGHDYRTEEEAHATYENYAWQSFGGVGLRLSQGVRLDSEVFYNGAMLKRDVVDANGVTWSETVDANGVGLRVGLNAVY